METSIFHAADSRVDGQIFVEILAGLVIYSSYHVRQITKIKSYHRLGIHTNKDPSAWTKVGSIP